MNPRTIIPWIGKYLSGLVLSSRRPCNIAAFHVGRCGSRVLGDLLKQNSRIFWDGELFSPERLDGIASRWPLLTRDRLSILKRRMVMAGASCYGFETQPTQVMRMEMTLPHYLDRLESLGFDHFILLHRKNYLRRIVSIEVARQSSHWHLQSEPAPRKVSIELNVDDLSVAWGPRTFTGSLLDHLKRSEQSVRELEESMNNRSLLQLTYEDDIQDHPVDAYRRVCEFIDVDYQPVEVRFHRTVPHDLSDVLTNFAEVAQSLQGTPFEWMLHA